MNAIISWFWRHCPQALQGPMTWIGHGLVGFALGFAFSLYGMGFTAGLYGYKEYLESDGFNAISLDNIMDFVCPVIGGALGVLCSPW